MKCLVVFFIAIIYLGYISLGLSDDAIGVVWPNARFELNGPQEYVGYFRIVISFSGMISSIISIRLTTKISHGIIVAVAVFLCGSGMILTGFFTLKELLFICMFLLGCGSGTIDSVLNEYVSNHYSSIIINWLHACWGIGAMIGPLIVTFWINYGYWRLAFYTLGGVQILVSFLFFATLCLWERRTVTESENQDLVEPIRPDYTMKNLAPWIGVFIFFLYVGGESAMGTWLKTLLYTYRHMSNTLSGIAVSVYYGSIMGGRILFGIFSKFLGNRNCVRLGILISLLGQGLLFIHNDYTAVVAVLLVGVGFAPLYPSLTHETARRFNKDVTNKTIGLQVASSSAGTMAFNPFVGWLGGLFSMEVLTMVVVGVTLLNFALIEVLNRMTAKGKEKGELDKGLKEDLKEDEEIEQEEEIVTCIPINQCKEV